MKKRGKYNCEKSIGRKIVHIFNNKLTKSTYVDFNTKEEIDDADDYIWCDDCFYPPEVKEKKRKYHETHNEGSHRVSRISATSTLDL